MNDNKSIVIIVVALLIMGGFTMIFSTDPKVAIEKEKTKQLELQTQYKKLQVDSMKVSGLRKVVDGFGK